MVGRGNEGSFTVLVFELWFTRLVLPGLYERNVDNVDKLTRGGIFWESNFGNFVLFLKAGL